jgi:GAF domain-containing protein
VPPILSDRVLGALTVPAEDAQLEDDLIQLRSLGNHAAIAIENARLYAETSDTPRRLARSWR